MDKHFLLSPNVRNPITVLEDITLVRLSLGEHVPLKSIKKRAKVAAGALVATHPSPNTGDLHAPFDAVVKDLTSTFIELEYEPSARAESPAAASPSTPESPDLDPADWVTPVSFDDLDPMALAGALKRLGIATGVFTRPCDLFIINCLNPEPGMAYADELLAGHQPILAAGFALLRRVSQAERFLFVLPLGSSFSIEGADVCHLKPVYPISLSRPMIRAVTGREDAADVALARLHALFQLGLVAASGLPLTRTIVTAFGKNYFAPVGTPVSTLLALSGRTMAPGDALILGGVMRGVSISGVRRGIRKEDDALALVKQGSRPPLEDNPCINCGACVSVCPMRLRPNMLSRYAEFEQYESCRTEYIDVCIECGMCGYVCPTCRPMQQLFRMAKARLGIRTLQHALRQ